MPLYPVSNPQPFVTISPYSAIHSEGLTIPPQSGPPSSSTWVAANRAIAYPIYLPDWVTVVKMWVANGAAVSGNIDIGIYNEAFSKLVSIGSTAQAGTSVNQVFDITDVSLAPGRYYVAVAMDNTTGTVLRSAITTPMQRFMGCVQMASAFPLPSTFTPATMANAHIPHAGITTRTTF